MLLSVLPCTLCHCTKSPPLHITGTRQWPARTLLLLQRGLGRVLGRAAAAVPIRASLAPAAAGDGRRQRLRQAPLRQQRELPRVQVRLRGACLGLTAGLVLTIQIPALQQARLRRWQCGVVRADTMPCLACTHAWPQASRTMHTLEEECSIREYGLHMKGRLSRARRRTTDCFSFSLKQCRQVKRSSLNSDLRRAGARARVRPACLTLTHRCGDARLRLLACFD